MSENEQISIHSLETSNIKFYLVSSLSELLIKRMSYFNLIKYCLLSTLLLGCITLTAQRNTINTYNVVLLNVSYGAHFPGGDLSNRFGNNFSIGGGLDLLTEKQNWIFGLKGNNLFGNTVKEDVLASIRDSDGFILGSVGAGQGSYADVFLRERGFYIGGHFGKLLSLSTKNKRSGIRLTLGAGILQHKVRIQDETGTADQVRGDLVKGYDQLSNGLAFEQFIGYQQLNRKTGLNFFAGFELTQAFTKNRRSFNFATQMQDTAKRFDVLLGFRVGWSLTFYVGERARDIKY